MIITADLHLRYDVPRCVAMTQEEWFEHQKSVLTFIVDRANVDKQDVYIAGDIFHTPVVHSSIVSMFIDAFSYLRGCVYVMPGNHDYLQRNPDLSRTSYGILEAISRNPDAKIKSMQTGQCDYIPYGETEIRKGIENRDILFMHQSVWGSNASIPPGCDGITMKDLLKKYPNYKLIVAGDTHTPLFYEDKGGNKVLVPGCVTKQAADFKEIALSIYEYDADGFLVSTTLPIVDNIVDDRYLVEEHARDERLEAFVESLRKTGGVALDFEENVENCIKRNKLKQVTIDTIRKLMEVSRNAQ